MRLRLVLLLVLLTPWRPQPSTIHAQASPPQILFLGDHLCRDDQGSCGFHATARFQYLHVILHDTPGNGNWRVQVGATCTDDTHDLAGRQPIPASGFQEVVVDLVSTAGGETVVGDDACYTFRGDNAQSTTFYAAYFDDSPLPDGESLFPHYQQMNGRPYLPDLDLTYIHRSPEYAYDASPNAPHLGQSVTFTAHLTNAGALPVPSFSYAWSVDGRQVARGVSSSSLSPEGEQTLNLHWTWQLGPHQVTLRVVPSGSEISTANDALTIRTDALSLGFWVERSAARYFLDNQWGYCLSRPCAGSDSLADWLERQVTWWNRAFARSVYRDIAPGGIADRVRVDEIVVVPDGSLPLHGGLATNDPDWSDRSVDMEWGLPSTAVAASYPTDKEGLFNIDTPMLHELGHARSLTDTYQFDVTTDGRSTFDIRAADGSPVYDPAHPLDLKNKLRAFLNDPGDLLLYRNSERDFMSCTCTPFYGRYHALVLNRIRGRRAFCGNTNPPCNLGDWFGDLPPVIHVAIQDAAGVPIAGSLSARLFFDGGPSYGGHVFRSANSIPLPVQNAATTLPPDPFHAGGSRGLQAHNLALLEVTTVDRDLFCFLEPSTFNMAYWEGYRDSGTPATFALRIGRQVENGCNLTPPPAIVNEPFATSPSASTLTLTRASSRSRWVVTARLRDDAVPANPMRARTVTFYAATTRLGQATTNARGIATLTLSGKPANLNAIDETDNNLGLSPPAAASPRSPARSP